MGRDYEGETDVTTLEMVRLVCARERKVGDLLLLRGIPDGTKVPTVMSTIASGSRQKPGEFGIPLIDASLLPLLMPALYEFAKWFAVKLGEALAKKTGESIASSLLDTIKSSFKGKPAVISREDARTRLDEAIRRRARELGIPDDKASELVVAVEHSLAAA